jgi:hypothetical protein
MKCELRFFRAPYTLEYTDWGMQTFVSSVNLFGGDTILTNSIVLQLYSTPYINMVPLHERYHVR